MNTFKIQGKLEAFWMKDLQADFTIKYGVKFDDKDVWTSKMSFLKAHWEQIEFDGTAIKTIVLMQIGRYFDGLSNFVTYASANGGEVAKEKDLVN